MVARSGRVVMRSDGRGMVALHRLIEREDAETLVREFAPLLPGVDFALADADGRVLAGVGEWPRTVPALPPALAKSEHTIHSPDPDSDPERSEEEGEAEGLTILPVWVDAGLVGAVIAKPGMGMPGLHEAPALRRSPDPDSDPEPSEGEEEREGAVEGALRCLHACATLLAAQALEKRDIARETLERYREINLLYQIGETIGGCLDAAEIPHLALAEAQRAIRAEAGAVLLPASGDSDAWEVRAGFGEGVDSLLLSDPAQRLIDRVRARGVPDIVERAPEGGERKARPYGSLLCAPLKPVLSAAEASRERTLGALLLGRLADRASFTASDEKLAMAIAGQAAIAIERAWLHRREVERQRMEEELSVARRIQLRLLPHACPDAPGWEFAASYRAAREVGGDFYDFFEAPDDPARLKMVIGDVTGKGVPAALMMAFSRALIRAESMSGRNPAEVLERVNRAIVHNRSQLLLTAFYAALDTRSGRMTFASGGHDWPLWLQSGTGECLELETRGIILGAIGGIPLAERAVDLAPGDVVVCFTDGVTEAQNAEGHMFGLERLRAVVTSSRHAGAQRVLTAIVAAVESFAGDTPQSDDLTVVVVKRITHVEEASHGTQGADRR